VQASQGHSENVRPTRLLTPYVFAALGLLFLVVIGAGWSALRQSADQGMVEHTLEAQMRIVRVFSLLQDAETGQRGYLLTGIESYLDPYNEAAPRLEAELSALEALMADNPTQRQNVDALREASAERVRIMVDTINLARGGYRTRAIDMVRSGMGRATMERIRGIVDRMLEEESRLLEARERTAAQTNFQLRAIIIIASIVALALGALVFTALRRFTATMTASRDALAAKNRELVGEIAARHAVEDQLVQSQKMEAVGQLTGGIAHDFNNTLAVVISAMTLLKKRLERGQYDVVQFADAAIDGARRAASLTNRLLAFSRLQPLTPEAIDTNKMVANMSELLHRTLGEQIEIETVLAAGLWRAEADPAQVESSILNLAINARDAMPEGGKITIETANCHLDDAYVASNHGVPPGQYVLIAVSDTGPGMAPEVLARAFDPFFTTKPVGKGTGLGLSQVYGFVKQSGGHIKIYSELGSGTAVKIYLPRSHREEAAERARDVAAVLPPVDPATVVLVVEDDDHVRVVTVATLRELGYTVIHADRPSKALELLQATPRIDLMFTDVIMPEMNGRKLADEVLKLRPDTMVLFTTGYTQNAIVHNGVLDPGADLLMKPFSVEQLASKVAAVLRRRQA
jgi:signal transduction histidine kinase/ActR/RegA family two-component response regulator